MTATTPSNMQFLCIHYSVWSSWGEPDSRLRKWVTTSTLYWSLIQSFRLPPNHWRSCCLQQ